MQKKNDGTLPTFFKRLTGFGLLSIWDNGAGKILHKDERINR